jgi:uncharacterized protein (DUF1800 family)
MQTKAVPWSDAWAPYEPDAQAPWTLRRVVHLHRRAGFAATWAELQRDLKDGPAAAVERLLSGQTAAAADFEATAGLLADAAVAAGDIGRLRAEWFYRMLLGPDPLGEKLTLLWHDHFATAHSKVRDPALMRRQNDTLRRHARGRFADLLNAAVREPALLLYLDAETNRQGHPNENLARELMELFTLGAGNYTEADVKEAARALTGLSVEEGRFTEAADRHDPGAKTILGRTGTWTGSDLLGLLLRHPATADRVAFKLCRQLFGEGAIPSEAVAVLAAGLREHDLDVGWAVATVLNSRLFFAEANLGTRVLGPVEFVVGAARALELFDPAPSTLALADWSARMGQELFEPPNVGGWPGGRAWLHARGLIARANYAAALLAGPGVGRSTTYDPAALPKAYGLASDPAAVLTFHHRLLFGTDPGDELRQRVGGVDGRRVVAVLLASPAGQLG